MSVRDRVALLWRIERRRGGRKIGRSFEPAGKGLDEHGARAMGPWRHPGLGLVYAPKLAKNE